MRNCRLRHVVEIAQHHDRPLPQRQLLQRDDEWLALCGVLGLTELAARADLATLAGRQAAVDAIEAAVSAATAVRDRWEVAAALQAAGVPAAPVLRHLKALGRAGLGHKTIGDAAKVSFSTVRKVLDGRRQHLRETTARRLFDVTREALADSALVPAGPTWKLLDELLEEGFTRTDLARRLGSKAKRPTIQIRRGKVEAATAAKVERLHRQLTR